MFDNLQNTTLRIGAVEFFPFFHFGGKNKFSGVSFEIIKILAKALNFNYEIFKVRPGGIFQNGKWTEGIIKAVNEGIYDIGADAVSMTYERYEAVEFTVPFMFDKSSIMSPAPTKTNRTFAVVQVFAPEVWFLVLFTILMFAPIMKLIENIRKKFNPKLAATEQVNIWNYAWMTFCLVLFKGIQSFKGSAPRIIILFWAVMMMVLVTIYSGTLLALMSEYTLSESIDTLKDLLYFRDISWGVFPSSATRSFIDTHERSPYVEISKKYNNDVGLMPKNISMAIELLRRNNYALISDEIIFKNIRTKELRETGICPYYISKDHLFIQWYSFITPKNSSFVKSINLVLQQLIESGLIDFWLRETIGTSLHICNTLLDTSSNALHELKFADVQGAFLVLILGFSLSVFCLPFEFIKKGRKITKKKAGTKINRRIVLKEEILNN